MFLLLLTELLFFVWFKSGDSGFEEWVSSEVDESFWSKSSSSLFSVSFKAVDCGFEWLVSSELHESFSTKASSSLYSVSFISNDRARLWIGFDKQINTSSFFIFLL